MYECVYVSVVKCTLYFVWVELVPVLMAFECFINVQRAVMVLC